MSSPISRKTLLRIKDALNASDADVKASLAREASGYRLVISAKDSGDGNKINIIVSDDDLNNTDPNGLSALSYDTNTARNMAESTPPYNAVLFADSSFFEKTENEITDAITGVNMKLLKKDDKFLVYITVSEDQSSLIFEKLDSFNNLTLKSMGFKFDTDDLISIDIGKINDAMISNLSSATTALNSLAGKLETTINSYIDSIIPGQQDTYRTLINEYIKAEKTTCTSFNR